MQPNPKLEILLVTKHYFYLFLKISKIFRQHEEKTFELKIFAWYFGDYLFHFLGLLSRQQISWNCWHVSFYGSKSTSATVFVAGQGLSDNRPVAIFITVNIIENLSVANSLFHLVTESIFRFMERRCENVYPNNDDPNFKIKLELLIRNQIRLCMCLHMLLTCNIR